MVLINVSLTPVSYSTCLYLLKEINLYSTITNVVSFKTNF